jgi:hypothetical protein
MMLSAKRCYSHNALLRQYLRWVNVGGCHPGEQGDGASEDNGGLHS